MRIRFWPVVGACGLLLVSATAASGQGMRGGIIPRGDDNWSTPPAPPASTSAQPPAPATTTPPPAKAAPAPTPNAPTPPATAAANPAAAQKLQQLRDLIAERKAETAATIAPLDTLELIAERMQEFRQRVDRAQRQPFLVGAQPPPDLVAQATAWQQKWAGLGDAIRAGKPPANVPAETLRRLSLPEGRNATGPVRMSGNLWSALSNDYFADTARIENLAETRATHVRESPKMRELAQLMNDAEARLRAIEAAPNRESEAVRRDLTWRLQSIWRLGAELQARGYEQELKAVPGEPALRQFLATADSARALRHRGLSLTAGGGAPISPDAPPPVLTPSPAPTVTTVRAQLGDVETSVNVAPTRPSQLAILAAELYHAHYLLANAAELGGEPERRRDYEGRRLEVLGEIVRETNRVLASGG